MAKYRANRRGMGQIARSAEMGRACEQAARPLAARIAASTPRDDGETAASTRVEPAMFSDRRGAYIVQEGAGVQVNFGNARTRAQHHMNRGVE